MIFLDWVFIFAVVVITALMAVLGLAIAAFRRGEIFHFPRIPKRKAKQKTEKTADEMMKEAIQELRSVPGGREWAEEQARIAGFNIPAPPTPQQIRTDRKVVQMTGGSPALFPTETGLLEINGTWYEKWINDKGSYLKEVAAPRAQEEVHEESTTVRDIASHVIAEHHCTCTSCSTDLPDGVREPARLDPDPQHS